MHKYPFAIRLSGFGPDERPYIANALAKAPVEGPGYFCLHDDSLQDPDLTIANGEDIKALAALMARSPTVLEPAIVIGNGALDFPYPRLHRPLDFLRLFAMIGELIDRRNEAQAQLTARGLPFITERRRKPRLDLDITEPSEYRKKRKPPPKGAVLIVDKGAALREHMARLMGETMSIEWTDSPAEALKLCEERAISLVMINTSMPALDPYGLTASIKAQRGGERVAVVLLVGASFHYHPARAHAAGVRGILDKPVADRHLIGTLKKIMSVAL